MSKKIRKIKMGSIDIILGKARASFISKSKIKRDDSKSLVDALKKEFERGGKIFPENRIINEPEYCFN